MTPPRRLLPLLAALVLSGAGCGLPEADPSTPEGAHYAFVHALRAGELDRAWDALHPSVRERFNAWQAAEKEAVKKIRLLSYPEGERTLALSALANGERADLADGKALFAWVVGQRPPPELDGAMEMGARVRSVTVKGDTAALRTWGGDRVEVQKADDGRWYRLLSEEETARLDRAVRSAEANLARVEKNIALMRGDAAASP